MDLIEAVNRRGGGTVRHPWETARLAVVRQLIARHATLGPGAVVLDVGCGDTFVTEQLAGESPAARFYAIDTGFTDDLLQCYRERLRHANAFLFPTLDAIEPALDREVSLVLLMDVIEHIEDDVAFLTDLAGRRYISSSTRVLITVPAYQRLFCAHDTSLGHFRRYSVTTLRASVEAAGLRVVESGYFFSSLLVPRALQAVRQRFSGTDARRGRTGLVTWNGGAAAAAVLTRLLVADAAIGLVLNRWGISLPGLSCYAVCRKSA